MKNLELESQPLSPTVELAWTGGWDSTFRLLQVLLIEEKRIQPHYIVRPESSCGQEIDAMHRIRRRLFQTFPNTRDLLVPTCFTDVREIVIEDGIRDEYESLKKEVKFNFQYLLLAMYCEQKSIDGLEIGVLDRDGFQILKERLVRRLRLPLLGSTKLEFLSLAKAHGFAEIMELTVFCRRPKGGKPCGFCGPCHDALNLGLGFRVPIGRRFIGALQAPFRRWWRDNYASMNPEVKGSIERLFRGRY